MASIYNFIVYIPITKLMSRVLLAPVAVFPHLSRLKPRTNSIKGHHGVRQPLGLTELRYKLQRLG
ncbi:hypothetical protein K469DRAFT_710865 [Zopfia rhizophila CBS 207.26]|uniref:Uncharacterized protein n=1 Tax=Zopfia rhizophila CBS 207.26 TaxID=1314779 RepID=A0A6A6DUV0_9PEZI|nr:hypothetical protein K469DRAFT_710865 [Zopfia rhizophila CBS 207.26]